MRGVQYRSVPSHTGFRVLYSMNSLRTNGNNSCMKSDSMHQFSRVLHSFQSSLLHTRANRPKGEWNDSRFKYGVEDGAASWLQNKRKQLDSQKTVSGKLQNEVSKWMKERSEREKKEKIQQEKEMLTKEIEALASEAKNFEELKVLPEFVEKMNNRNIKIPTEIQKRAIPVIASGRSVFFQSQTGTGKTLGYLLPILQKLKSTNNAKPFEVMIIVPSRELGMQVFDEIQYLGYSSKESMLLVAGNESVDDQLKLVNENKPQVVVGSASRLLEILQKNKRLLQHVKTVVIDEADKVFQPLSAYASAKQKYNRIKHPKEASVILDMLKKAIKSAATNVQMVCASATLNSPLRKELAKHGWNKQYIIKAGETFRIPSSIEHQYVLCDPEIPKLEQVCVVMQEQNIKSSLLFIPPTDKMDATVSRLKKHGFKCVALHEHVNEKSKRESFIKSFQQGEIEVVVATEETARGLDFPWLSHVLLTYAPSDANTYLHLAGRTGRLGNKGTVISFFNKDEIDKKHLLEKYLCMKFDKLKV